MCKLQFRRHPSWRPGSYQLLWKEGLGWVADFWDFPMLALIAASPMAQGQSSEEGPVTGHLQQSTQTRGWSIDQKWWLQSWLVNFRAWIESLAWSVGLKESAMGQATESQCGSMQDIHLYPQEASRHCQGWYTVLVRGYVVGTGEVQYRML